MRTKKPKEPLSARVDGVVKELIRVERGDASDGEFIEALVVSNVKTAQGKRLLADWAASNPLVQALLQSLPKTTLAGFN